MKIHKCDESKCEEKKPKKYPLSYNDIIKQEGVYKTDVPYSTASRFVVLRNYAGDFVCLYFDDTICEVANRSWTCGKFKRLPNAKLIMEVVDE